MANRFDSVARYNNVIREKRYTGVSWVDWKCHVLRCTAGTLSFFLDGVPQISYSVGPWLGGIDEIRLSLSTSFVFKGGLAHFALWNRGWDDASIADLADAT